MTGGNVNSLLSVKHESLLSASEAEPSARAYKPLPISANSAAAMMSTSKDISNGGTSDQNPPSSPAPHQRKSPRLPSELGPRRGSSRSSSIAASMQIPPSINNSKGSLAEFAAQITCLFWFESSFILQTVEESKAISPPTSPLVAEAIPSMGFRKWVTTILSTTQVTQNVILLALMFIYRLKKLNPTVKGKVGSEFRLLTVALMLGNKFLDDNTYTNKTWAEVSGISVQEIHIMEVEFLSNMRYSLYTSESDWKEWQSKLRRFWNHFERASRTSHEAATRPSGSSTPALSIGSTLPSPPSSNHASPPLNITYPPVHPSFPHPLSMPPHLAPTNPSPMLPMPESELLPSSRKRSRDDGSQEPPAKRPLRSSFSSSVHSRTGSLTPTYTPNVAPQMPRLPVPNLSISTAQPTNGFTASAQLPPPGRAMSIAYPSQTPAGWTQAPAPTLSSLGHPASHGVPISSYGDHARRQSPHPPTSLGSSPTTAMFPSSNLSPSYILTNRNSPYRPVRTVSTLLVPPPSGAIRPVQQHATYPQMHYQPLSKGRHEYRTGVVPYTQYDNWPQLQQGSQYPFLPQPNFSG
ncbi:MAG: hypothetical protein M1825_001960 [Sarcosagium campestre]|nr:MAG: hypothetical protein M1825_001960 [Sarcosagium campestre]